MAEDRLLSDRCERCGYLPGERDDCPACAIANFDAVRGDLHGTPGEWPERQPMGPTGSATARGHAGRSRQSNLVADSDSAYMRALKAQTGHSELEAEVERLRAIITDLIEGETAEEGTPQWYALRNARAALSGALDEEEQT